MRTLGNFIWFVLVGWWQGTLYLLLSLLLCITIIGIPVGKALFQYAMLMYLPFGKKIVRETFIKGSENVSSIRKIGGVILNILWFPIGFVLLLINIPVMIASFVSIIGIPAGIVIARSCIFLLSPIGAKVISHEQAQAIYIANEVEARTGNVTTSAITRIKCTCGFSNASGAVFCGDCGGRI